MFLVFFDGFLHYLTVRAWIHTDRAVSAADKEVAIGEGGLSSIPGPVKPLIVSLMTNGCDVSSEMSNPVANPRRLA